MMQSGQTSVENVQIFPCDVQVFPCVYLIPQQEVDVLFLPVGRLAQSDQEDGLLQRLTGVEDDAVALLVGQELVWDADDYHLHKASTDHAAARS